MDRREFIKISGIGACSMGLPSILTASQSKKKPNIILCMTDDQGWGDTGYNGHPVLKTPELDKMAKSGIQFDRFYAASPVCSPTRGSVLTGRHPYRYGCRTHGSKLDKSEQTIAQVLQKNGYATGHFGKWHLNGVRGPGKPIDKNDPHGPGQFGFDHWFSVSNYFDLNTTFSRNGKNVTVPGDGSDALVDEALDFINHSKKSKKPFLAVIWYGSPHVPLKALPKDKAPYGKKGDYLGELAGVDRSIGTLRKGLRKLNISKDTIVWFCSDNGPKKAGESTKGLRGKKLEIYEGGIRVPGIIEWPGHIKKPFKTNIPCSTSDIFPTLMDIAKVKSRKQSKPLDGINLMPLIDKKMKKRIKPIAFEHNGHAALIDNDYKFHIKKGKKELFNLSKDDGEGKDISSSEIKRAKEMEKVLLSWKKSVKNEASSKKY